MTRRKLIEVALPLEQINIEGERDKSLNRGHPKSLHWWWARRPLAVCRAVIFAQLVDDPSSYPERFPTAEAQEAERERLFGVLKRLVMWENSNDPAVLEEARAEIVRSTDATPPGIVDPFCGGGTIPVEARRLGLEAIGADLNPVAVLITKAMIDIPARFADRPPISRSETALSGTHGGRHASAGLAADLEHYGRLLLERVRAEIGPLFSSEEGAIRPGDSPLAWLWARSVRCPNPGCAGVIPLVNSFWLSRTGRSGGSVWARPVPTESKSWVRFEIAVTGSPPEGTVRRNSVTCLLCGNPTTVDYVKTEAKAGRMGKQLLATVVEAGGRRAFRPGLIEPTVSPEQRIAWLTEKVPFHPQYLQLPRYGFETFDDLYSSRQLSLMKCLAEALGDAREEMESDGAEPDYADALVTYLAFLIDRTAARNCTQAFWDATRDNVQSATSLNYMPMRWTYAEANPFAKASGSAAGQLDFLIAAIGSLPSGPRGQGLQLDAARASHASPSVFCTDPPYYDNIPYSDLSDFYYVLLKRTVGTIYPDLFSTILTPKAPELVADSTRHGGKEGAAEFFRHGFETAFEKMKTEQHPDIPLVVYYALRQKESGEGVEVATGWDRMLQGLIDAGLQVTATWPFHTEQRGGLRAHRRNALASSIAIACRGRAETAPLASLSEFRAQLRKELPDALRRLQMAHVAPVDFAQAAIGPGMAVFSRYSRVLQADGSSMPVRTALLTIIQAVDEILAEQESEYDSATRWAVSWYELHGMTEGPYGDAELLAKAKNVGIEMLVRDGFLAAGRNRVRLLTRDELRPDWDPTSDARPTIWEMTQHLALALDRAGETGAADLLRRIGLGSGAIARDLAYRLYRIAEGKNWVDEAIAYNALVAAWPDIARAASRETGGQEGLGV